MYAQWEYQMFRFVSFHFSKAMNGTKNEWILWSIVSHRKKNGCSGRKGVGWRKDKECANICIFFFNIYVYNIAFIDCDKITLAMDYCLNLGLLSARKRMMTMMTLRKKMEKKCEMRFTKELKFNHLFCCKVARHTEQDWSVTRFHVPSIHPYSFNQTKSTSFY